jgi:hypothetical protein
MYPRGSLLVVYLPLVTMCVALAYGLKRPSAAGWSGDGGGIASCGAATVSTRTTGATATRAYLEEGQRHGDSGCGREQEISRKPNAFFCSFEVSHGASRSAARFRSDPAAEHADKASKK